MAIADDAVPVQPAATPPVSKSGFPMFVGGLVLGLVAGLFGGAVGMPYLERAFGIGGGTVTTESATRRPATPEEQAKRQRDLVPTPPAEGGEKAGTPGEDHPKPVEPAPEHPKPTEPPKD